MAKKYSLAFLLSLFVFALPHQDLSAQYQVQSWVIGGGDIHADGQIVSNTDQADELS